MPLRSMVVSPPVFSAAEASGKAVPASRTVTVPLPVPEPVGWSSELFTTREDQAVTIRPVAAPIALVTAEPEAEKLTGAVISSTLSRLGEDVGVDRRARQRTPCTVSSRLSASVGDVAVTGK